MVEKNIQPLVHRRGQCSRIFKMPKRNKENVELIKSLEQSIYQLTAEVMLRLSQGAGRQD